MFCFFFMLTLCTITFTVISQIQKFKKENNLDQVKANITAIKTCLWLGWSFVAINFLFFCYSVWIKIPPEFPLIFVVILIYVFVTFFMLLILCIFVSFLYSTDDENVLKQKGKFINITTSIILVVTVLSFSMCVYLKSKQAVKNYLGDDQHSLLNEETNDDQLIIENELSFGNNLLSDTNLLFVTSDDK